MYTIKNETFCSREWDWYSEIWLRRRSGVVSTLIPTSLLNPDRLIDERISSSRIACYIEKYSRSDRGHEYLERASALHRSVSHVIVIFGRLLLEVSGTGERASIASLDHVGWTYRMLTNESLHQLFSFIQYSQRWSTRKEKNSTVVESKSIRINALSTIRFLSDGNRGPESGSTWCHYLKLSASWYRFIS